ncbi:GH1 family beta-glucosidase [Phaeacidiphilus oryzae]|uniref:GH1 family beta-glucosidase n=1 Tax=Phaeacidiphilus oryzae TaxID=348818 RepID=UPI000690F62B|nr:GH1 family beta-glucosidase [Phaeacidiphilus oryzae]
MPAPDTTAFGPGFAWGVATSAYQIEGAVAEDGRTPSIWDTFCARPGAVDNGDTGETACDHYHRWPEDLALMGELGVDSYRFSLAWPRIVPDGTGKANEAGLDFYDRLTDSLLAAGIRPNATLYHWDLPQSLQDRGGWPERATAEAFAEYAAVAAARLGDRITEWCTVNEPLCVAWIGHLEGRMAPGLTDPVAAVRASYHLQLGHGLAVQAVRAASPGPVRIGIVNNLSPCEPATDSEADRAAAVRADGHINRWWLDPVLGRGHPADMRAEYAAHGAELPERAGDQAVIAQPLDWLGVNYYFRQLIADDPDPAAAMPRIRQVPGPGPRTGMDWEVHAAGLEQLLLRLTREYGARRLLVTENGAAYPDTVRPDGSVHDPERARYLTEHLAACARAAEAGAPVDGYYVWSLLDNFEWAYGYDKRFGLVHVDFETQRRRMKSSGRAYAALIAAHRAATARSEGAGTAPAGAPSRP